jgi:lipopolysaccharide transport system ATP-binding protein
MNDIVIKAENLGKKYTIGHQAENGRYTALRDVLMQNVGSLWRKTRDLVQGKPIVQGDTLEEVWALKDVSFDIRRGEAVGIIGRNGAGKSTLLKILSRITEPSTGRVTIKGRVASLLEVGTGFHPELTGRENIYLNGAILGMTRQEIKRKFDEIVAFAEVEQYLDTPVKRYSSGMYVRLAFAVAAHLEPEILLVDEVLAVGDAAFQKKCLGTMGDVAKEGRTVVFVSHNMATILSLCEVSTWLDSGRFICHGPTQEVVQHYLQSTMSAGIIPLDQRQDRAGDGSARIISLRLESTAPDKVIRSTSCLKVTIGYWSEKSLQRPNFLVGIYDCTNTGIFLLNSDAVGGFPKVLPPKGSVTCLTEPIKLTPGRCYVNLALLKGGAMADYIQYAGYFDVEAEDVYGSGKIPPRDWVLCVLRHEWSLDGS